MSPSRVVASGDKKNFDKRCPRNMLGLYRTLWKKWRKNLDQLILGAWCFLVAVVATMGWCLLHAYFCSSMTAFSEGTSAVSRIVDIVFSNFSS